jgi:hypothetical protein
MKWITEHWNKLLAILAVCIGGIIGLFGAVLIFQVQIGALHGEVDSLKLMIKGLESVEQSSLVALSKANKALESSNAAQELTKTAGAGVDQAKEAAEQSRNAANVAESVAREALTRSNTANQSAQSALQEAKASLATAVRAIQQLQNVMKSWPSGTYCVLKGKGACPAGFKEGYLHFDTEDDRGDNRWDGQLPAGSYLRNNLDLIFCCK